MIAGSADPDRSRSPQRGRAFRGFRGNFAGRILHRWMAANTMLCGPLAPRRSPMFTCALLLAFLPVQSQSPNRAPSTTRALLPCGHWEPSFQHDMTGFPPILPRFNAAHMVLIPKGPHRGKVMVWDIMA